MAGAELVGPLPTVTFRGGPTFYDRSQPPPQVAYDVPRNTMDPRYVLCTDHRVACDCREAEFAEDREEQRAERRIVWRATWSALQGHQVNYPVGLTDVERVTWHYLCRCSGCVIVRATYGLLPPNAIDWMTGRVQPYRYGDVA